MSDKEHLAVQANKKSIKYAMEGNREAWLALYTDDALVQDPVGVSPMDPTGKGHKGKEAITAFWDATIGPEKLDIRVEKRWTSGDYRCCVAQVAHNDLGDGNVILCDMLAIYDVNEEGKITSMSANWSFDDLAAQLGQIDKG